MAIPFAYFIDLTRHAALGTPTMLSEITEYVVAFLLSIPILIVRFVAFNRIEEEIQVNGSIATN